ncbi:MAG: SLC13 family permease [Candidatus Kariarchaeaceae archaeon]
MSHDNLIPVILVIFMAVYYGIIKHVNKALVGGLGAIATIYVMLFSGAIHSETDLLLASDFLTLAVLIGMMIIVTISSESGLFVYISIKIMKITKGDPTKLLYAMTGLAAGLTIVVNNISAALIVGSLTIITCQRLDLDARPYILSLIVIVNLAGLFTPISSIPSLIVALGFQLSFISFTIIGGSISIYLIFITYLIITRIIKVPSSSHEALKLEKLIAEFDPWSAVDDKKFFYTSAVVLVLTVMGFMISDIVGVSIALVSLTSALILSALSKSNFDEALAEVDLQLIGFFLGLFIIIEALKELGFIDDIASFLSDLTGGNFWVAIIVILVIGGVISAVLDNIVFCQALTATIPSMGFNFDQTEVLAYTLVVAAMVGGNLTPIGSPSTIVSLRMLENRVNIHIGWGEYLKAVSLLVAIHMVAAILPLFCLALFPLYFLPLFFVGGPLIVGVSILLFMKKKSSRELVELLEQEEDEDHGEKENQEDQAINPIKNYEVKTSDVFEEDEPKDENQVEEHSSTDGL